LKTSILAMLTLTSLLSAQEFNPVKATSAITAIEEAFNSAKIIICIDDIHESFWTNPNVQGSMFINYFLLDGTNTLTRKVVKEMLLYDPYGASWSEIPDVFKLRLGSWGNFYSTRYSFDGSVLPLGEYFIEISTTDGLVYRRGIRISDFSSHIAASDTFIYSAVYSGKVRQGYINSIARPIVTSFVADDEAVLIDFKVNDPRVRNAAIAFYDENKKYVGGYEYFYNSFSDQIRHEVNNGEKIHIDGSINKISLESKDISFEANKNMGNIYQAIIIVYNQDNPEIFSIQNNMIRMSTRSEMTFKSN